MAQQNVKTEKQNEKQQGLTRYGAMTPSRLFTAPADVFRWNPFTTVGRIMEEMDRMAGMRAAAENRGMPLWSPPIEISQHNGEYEIRAELAGLKPEDVKVEVNGDALVLEGERKLEQEEDKDGVYRTERLYGRFYRSIPLPEGANVDRARARFENGVLAVTVPVTEVSRNHKQIPVDAGSAVSTEKTEK
jgi:HSP20 family protein